MPTFYGTVEEADAYHADRGNPGWVGRDIDKTASLVRASTYVDSVGRRQQAAGTWESLFPGIKAGGRAQTLEWPRVGAADYEGMAIDAEEVPIEVKQATYEAALRELGAPGSLSPDYVPSALLKSEKAGPWEEEYFAPAAGTIPNRPVVSIVLDLLAPVMVSRILGTSIMVV